LPIARSNRSELRLLVVGAIIVMGLAAGATMLMQLPLPDRAMEAWYHPSIA